MVERSAIQVILILILTGILFVTATFYIEHQYGLASEGFVPTTAEVINTEVDVIQNNDEPDDYSPEITYQYEVDGINYTNDEYSAGSDRYNSRADAQEIVDQYEIGENITIYYNPDNPGDSLIVKGIQDRSIRGIRITLWSTGIVVFFLTLITLPDAYYYYKKFNILNGAKSGEHLKYSSKDLSYPHSTSTTKKMKYYKPAMELNSPWNEKFNQIKDDLVSAVSGYLLMVGFILNPIALLVVTGSTNLFFEVQAIINFYAPERLLVTVSWAIVIMFASGMLLYMISDADSLGMKIVMFIAFPFSYLFLTLFSLIAILFLPLIIGLLVAVTAIVYLIPYLILFILDLELTSEQNAVVIVICAVLAIIVLSYIDYERTQLDLKYSNLSVGHKHYDHAYSNGKTELYCIDQNSYLLTGSKTGELILIDEKSNLPNRRLKVHEGAIIEIKYLDDMVYTISNDLTFQKISIVRGELSEVSSYKFSSIPRVMALDTDFLYVGLDDGSVSRIDPKYSLDHVTNHKFFNGMISAIEVDEDYLYVGSEDKYVKIFDKTTFDQVGDIKVHKDTISDILLKDELILTSSLDGGISITWKEELTNHRVISIPDKNNGVVSLEYFENILLAGSSNGILYRIHLGLYEPPEKGDRSKDIVGLDKFKIHNHWIEDIHIFGDYLYTVSADATLKTLHLFDDLDLTLEGEEKVKSIEMVEEIERGSSKMEEMICKICGETVDDPVKCHNCKNSYHFSHFHQAGQATCPNCHEELN